MARAAPFPDGRGPYNLELDPRGDHLVVTYKSSAAIGIWDLEEAEELARVETTRRVPHGVVISPDSRFAFISNEGIGGESGTVDVIDLEARERVASVEVGLQAGGITFWKQEERGTALTPRTHIGRSSAAWALAILASPLAAQEGGSSLLEGHSGHGEVFNDGRARPRT